MVEIFLKIILMDPPGSHFEITYIYWIDAKMGWLDDAHNEILGEIIFLLYLSSNLQCN